MFVRPCNTAVVAAHLGVVPRTVRNYVSQGLMVAYRRPTLDTPSNATPWAHVEDLADLAERPRAA